MLGALCRSLKLPHVVSALTLLVGASVQGQTYYTEDFENMGFVPIGEWGPQGLMNEGWTFVNNSNPLGTIGYVSGCCWGGIIDPLSGTGYLSSYQDSSGGDGSQYSNWAILPAIAGQQAGDIFTFYSVSSDTSPFESVHLEVRYSPSGGSNVGNNATSVGDFTTLLLFISPMPNYNTGLYDGWTKWEIPLPGSGRIAFRQVGSESMYFGLEDVSAAHPEPDPGPMPEGFEDLDGTCGEGPCRLINEQGWIFRDQGSLSIGPAWQAPVAGDSFTPHSGFSFIKSSKGGASGSISTWAILPPIGSQDGDELSFAVRGDLQSDAKFEVRYSPSGGTGTGSGLNGVGDFTQVLLQMTALPYDAWQEISVPIPGNGRIALRLFDPFQSQFDFVNVVAVDTMDLNAKPSGPPLPGPGETVIWTLADSPIIIHTDLFIPPGGTVIVQPGVEIQIDEESTLSIGGTLQGDGTPANPIIIDSVANFPPGMAISGTLDLSYAEINTNLHPDKHGSLLLDHCTFAGPNAYVFNESVLITDNEDTPPFILLDNCVFEDGNFSPSDATLRMTNSTFLNSTSATPLRGYVYADNLVFDGGSLSISRDQQNVLIDNITVQNSPGPAINVGGSNVGTDYFFGPNNTLVGNLYPVAAGAGILPGSVLPAQGNAFDAVLVQPLGFEIFGPVTWADAGVPYHVFKLPYLVGEFNLLPGVTMQFAASSGFGETSAFQSRGLPDNPVIFERLDGVPWYGIFTPQRLEYTVVDGSQFGMINDALGLPGFYDNCVFSNNDRAQVGGAIIRKSQFLNNNVGANIGFTMDLNGQSNPNWFEGNTLAVQDASDARFNWWGSPTGPSGPQNPGGTGDPVAPGVPVTPFRTTPPDLQNHPPIINMQELYFVAAPGSTIILNWNATDDDLVSQRVLLSTQADVPSHYIFISDDLPPTQRSYALTVPGTAGVYYVRIEGVDSLGQIGWDTQVSSARPVSIDPSIVLPLSKGQPHHILGHPIPVDETISFFNTGWVLLDGQLDYESFGAWGVLPTEVSASTDSVRFGMTDNESWTFSDPMVVRPDERIGDAAPTVTLLTPQPGAYPGGSALQVSWTAADDEGIRYASVQASYDGGITFHDVVRRLPGTTTSYNWPLPPLDSPISNVHVRVVVEDLRFQNSSATSGPITLTSGSAAPPGDSNGDGVVDVDDLIQVINFWGACAPPCPADMNADGVVDVDDLLIVINNWS